MATLVVRRLDDDIMRGLRERARRHGRSVEAEARAIFAEAIAPRATTRELIEALEGSWIGELDPDQLRERPGTERGADLAAEDLERIADAFRSR